MKLINTGTIDITVEGTVLPAGKVSDNVDDLLARQIVASSGGSIALAPESEHTVEELEHADEKPKPEPPPEPSPEGSPAPAGRLDQYRIKGPVTPEGEERKKKAERPSTKTGS